MSYNSKNTGAEVEEALDLARTALQEDQLKTVNGQSIIGEGNIEIKTGLSEEEVNTKIAEAITTVLNTEV